MALEFCCPEAGTGSVADWAAVLVAAWTAVIAALAAVIGIAGAAATVWVGLLAHRTSKRATEIADRAAQIAQQQHGEAVKLREENARIIGRLLLYEVIALPDRVSGLLATWDVSIETEPARRILDGRRAMNVLSEAEQSLLPGAERVEDRIHNLPDSIGADLATLIGGSRTLGELVRKIRARMLEPSSIGSKWGYAGDKSDFAVFRHQLVWLQEISGHFAAEFRSFVGVGPDEELGPDRTDD